jgi:hypothetical protein
LASAGKMPADMDATRRPLTLSMMARRLRVPVGWLRAEALAGRVPHLPAGRQILMDPEAVEVSILERAAAPMPPGRQMVHAS